MTVRDTVARVSRSVPEPDSCTPNVVVEGQVLVACFDAADAWAVIDGASGASRPIPGLQPGDVPDETGRQWVLGTPADASQSVAVNWHTGQRVQLPSAQLSDFDLDQPVFGKPVPNRIPQTYPGFDFDGEQLVILVTKHTRVRHLPGCEVLSCRALAADARFAVYGTSQYVGVYDISHKRFYSYRNTRWPKFVDDVLEAAVTLHELEFVGPRRGGGTTLYRAKLP